MTTLVQYFNYPFLYAVDCQVAVTGNKAVSISTGQLRDSTNSFDLLVSSSLSLSASSNGVNALDSGSVAANTWYAVYVIYDPTRRNPVAGLLSTSSTAPVMPSANGVTYGAFRLVGWVLTDGSSNFLVPYIIGNGNSRKNIWNDHIAVLTNGTASTATNVGCSGAVAPVDNSLLLLDVSFTVASAGNYVQVRPYGSSSTSNSALSNPSGTLLQIGQLSVLSKLNSSTPTFQYYHNAASCSSTMYVRSFEYFI